jgi:hypothetical protein
MRRAPVPDRRFFCLGLPVLRPRNGNPLMKTVLQTLLKTWPRAVLKSPHSRRFAKVEAAQPARQRLDCGAFTAAFQQATQSLGALGSLSQQSFNLETKG